METKVIKVTPAIAREWLQSNTINRPLRRSVVDGYKSSLIRGEYVLTHQGIAFADTGELLDGQHRLMAISELPDHYSFQINVTRGLPVDAFKGIDQGLKRTHSDVLGVSSGLAGVARYMAVINDTKRAAISSQLLIPIINGIQKAYDDLWDFCPKSTKTWSSMPVRAAALLNILGGGDRDYVLVTYHAFCHSEFDSMSMAAQSLYRQQVQSGFSSNEMFVRCMRVFDIRNSEVTILKVVDPAPIFVQAREIINTKVLGLPTLRRNQAKPLMVSKAKERATETRK